jgi:hypothetical protein
MLSLARAKLLRVAIRRQMCAPPTSLASSHPASSHLTPHQRAELDERIEKAVRLELVARHGLAAPVAPDSPTAQWARAHQTRRLTRAYLVEVYIRVTTRRVRRCLLFTARVTVACLIELEQQTRRFNTAAFLVGSAVAVLGTVYVVHTAVVAGQERRRRASDDDHDDHDD